jgi:hypothetical protein
MQSKRNKKVRDKKLCSDFPVYSVAFIDPLHLYRSGDRVPAGYDTTHRQT